MQADMRPRFAHPPLNLCGELRRRRSGMRSRTRPRSCSRSSSSCWSSCRTGTRCSCWWSDWTWSGTRCRGQGRRRL